jgi:threonyl-tRNA synthetase
VQVVVATITADADAYAREVVTAADAAGLRVTADLRNEKITYKVREHSLAKVPVLIVVGKKEAAERTVSIRRLGSPDQRSESLADALEALTAEAVPPDVRRRAGPVEVGEPSAHVVLDGHHVHPETVA